MKRTTTNDTSEGDIAIDNIRNTSRQLETHSDDEGQTRKDGTLHLDSRKEIERWIGGEWTVDIARQPHKRLKDITRDLKARLKTIIREKGA